MTNVKQMNTKLLSEAARGCLLALVIGMTSSCASLLPASPPPPTTYTLQALPNSQPALTQALPANATQPTLIVHTPHAASGYQSRHMMYTRLAHQLEYYAQSEWVAPPAQMLAPLILQAMQASVAFSAVVMAPTHVVADYRLDTEMIRLQQDFTRQPSTVQLTVRVYLIHNATRKVVAVREFDEVATASSEDAYGGVIAANQVVHHFLEKLTAFSQTHAVQAQLSVTPPRN
ncbi:MAG TPA: ABC-type transport auxiliary lipoprotein family protein [Methylophilus sp.]